MIKELKIKYPSEFNGEEYLSITSKLSPFYFEKYEGFGMAQIRQEARFAGNSDGLVKGNSLYGGRILSVEGNFHAKTRTELLELRGQLEYALSLGQLGSREPREMIIILDNDTEDELSIDVFLNSDPDFAYNKGERHFGAFRFEMASEDVLFTSTAENSQIIPIYSSLFGFPIVFPIPFTLGNTSATITNQVNNGNTPADTIFEFTNQVTNPNINNKTNGQSFTVTEVVNEGDEMIVDSLNESVLLKRSGDLSYTDITSKFIGQFIKLNPGENEIIFSGQNTNSDTTVTVKWSNSYIGI